MEVEPTTKSIPDNSATQELEFWIKQAISESKTDYGVKNVNISNYWIKLYSAFCIWSSIKLPAYEKSIRNSVQRRCRLGI